MAKGFRNTINYSKAPITEQFNIDVSKTSEVSDSSHLDVTKPLDDSAQNFIDSESPYYKKVNHVLIPNN
jgi:hypothetical protein